MSVTKNAKSPGRSRLPQLKQRNAASSDAVARTLPSSLQHSEQKKHLTACCPTSRTSIPSRAYSLLVFRACYCAPADASIIAAMAALTTCQQGRPSERGALRLLPDFARVAYPCDAVNERESEQNHHFRPTLRPFEGVLAMLIGMW
jgi:hypothetical protein